MRATSPLLLAVLACLLVAPTGAEDKPVLTIYTYDSFAAEQGPGPALKAGFEQTCGCTVDFVAADSSIGALRRLQLEGPSSPADVVLGLDTAVAGEARATGLFAPHEVDLSGLTLPFPWTDPVFVPFDHGYFAFVYDRDRVAEPPGSFPELIAMPKDFRIVLQDPRSDTPGFGLLLWIKAAYGERAPEIWAGLKPHILTMARSWSDAYALFLNGEADMVLSYSTSPAYHTIMEGDTSIAAATFIEGNFTQIEVASVVRSTRHHALARDFLAYLISPEAQAIIPTTNWMYPVRPLHSGLPAGFPEPPGPDTVLWLEEAAITSNRSVWIEEALAALR